MLQRKIEPEFVRWLDLKLQLNGLAQEAIKEKNARLLFGLAAESCVGIRESNGNNNGPMVRLIQETVGRAEGEPWCFIGQTEVLTEHGWQRFDELERGVKVAQVDDGRRISYAHPDAYIEKDYAGPGYNIKTRSLDIVCDRGHKFFGHFNNSPDARFGTLDELTTLLKVPLPESSAEGVPLTDTDIKFLAAFLADGFYKKTRQGRPRISIQVSRERKIERLSEFERVGFYTASRSYGLSKTPLSTFTFLVPDYFSEIFDDYKALKWSFVNQFSKRQAQLFLNEYCFYDGHRPNDSENSFKISCSRKDLADQILTLGVLAGFAPAMSVSVSPTSGRENYGISWSPGRESRTLRKHNVYEVELNEKLYCVSMPHGRIIVRGSPTTAPMLVGNCASFVQTCLAYAEEKTGVKSLIAVTEHVQTMWNDTPKLLRVKMTPLKYAIICWKKEGTSSGHTGIVTEAQHLKFITTVEGNTNAAGSREGDGVYLKRRNWYREGSLVKMGFLKPFA